MPTGAWKEVLTKLEPTTLESWDAMPLLTGINAGVAVGAAGLVYDKDLMALCDALRDELSAAETKLGCEGPWRERLTRG